MKRILLYVEPDSHERDQLVAWAADLVEAITAREGGVSKSQNAEVGVVADPLDCLEIGIVALGRGTPRTVEGGERNNSPVILFPFIPTYGDESAEEAHNSYECLRELSQSGAVEGIIDNPENTVENVVLPSAEIALRTALESGDWEIVVALGKLEWSRMMIENWSSRNSQNRVVRPMLDDLVREKVEMLLRRVEPEVEDNYRQERLLAVKNAVQLSAMMEQLALDA